MNSFEVALKSKQLPTKIGDLVPLSFIGNEAVKYYQSKIRLFDNLGISEEQRDRTLKDGQDAGIMLLDIESQIGKLLNELPKTKTGRTKDGELQKVGYDGKGTKSREAYNAKIISSHPDEVKDVISEAKENKDIPTKTAVLNKVKYNKEKKRREKAESEGRNQKMDLEIRLEEQVYIQSLEKFLLIVPKTPPKDWTETGFNKARSLVNLIIKRLEVFNG